MTTIKDSNSPKLLLVHRYVSPDSPAYGWMLLEIAAAGVAAGYDVEIFSTQPSYVWEDSIQKQAAKELRDGYIIHRVKLPLWHWGDFGKAIAGAWFALRAFVHTIFGRFDVVMAATTPPVVVSRAVSLAASLRGASFIYHCQDIHPEIVGRQGPFRWKIIMSLFRWLDRQTCRVAKQIVVLSSDMKLTIVNKRGVNPGKLNIINNFLFRPTGQETQRSVVAEALDLIETGAPRFRIIFSGNLGRFQGLDDLLEGAVLARPSRPVELIFVGSGNVELSLRKRAREVGIEVRFLGRQPKEVADHLVSLADIAVISLRPGLINYAYPSKTLDYLAAGTRILAIVEPESELARMILENGIGVVASPGSREEIARAIEKAADDRADMAIRTNMQALSKSLFGKENVLCRWQEMFGSLKKY